VREKEGEVKHSWPQGVREATWAGSSGTVIEEARLQKGIDLLLLSYPHLELLYSARSAGIGDCLANGDFERSGSHPGKDVAEAKISQVAAIASF
jgi:hypothetical protein